MTGALFDRITIIGLGLIGSSIARAVKERHLAETITGCDQNNTALTFARSEEFIDVAVNDPRAAVSESQLVILATPPSTFSAITRHISSSLKPGTMLMDTASVKVPTMASIAANLPSHVDFVPAHPIAGSEKSGVRAGRGDLFHRRRIIVTPDEPLQDTMLQAITSFWVGMGARVEAMPPALHDLIYAYMSHLPQLLAYAVRGILMQHDGMGEINDPLKKFLRLSHSTPDLWIEIFELNKVNILNALDRYIDVISHIESELLQAPAENKSTFDDMLARSVLFPRIASSCLISTVMEVEKQQGISFARYAGTGFADFTAPATTAPDSDIERISDHYAMVIVIMREYAEKLAELRGMIAEDRFFELKKALAN